VVNIFHDNRHAFPRRLVSDAAAHNACAQHRGLFRRFNVFGEFLRFAFYILIVKENADQCASFVGMRQRDKTFVFQI
ncbi:hypothetical protein Q604_UNBC11695G0001, partial [human gut metagenome]